MDCCNFELDKFLWHKVKYYIPNEVDLSGYVSSHDEAAEASFAETTTGYPTYSLLYLDCQNITTSLGRLKLKSPEWNCWSEQWKLTRTITGSFHSIFASHKIITVS